jgi:hypothetical protein
MINVSEGRKHVLPPGMNRYHGTKHSYVMNCPVAAASGGGAMQPSCTIA